MITNEQIEIVTELLLDSDLCQEDVLKALEAYEQDKWVRFDVDDVSTHPENGKYALVKIDKTFLDELGYLDTTYVGEFFNGGFDIYIADECGCAVTHWQPLPQFKK